MTKRTKKHSDISERVTGTNENAGSERSAAQPRPQGPAEDATPSNTASGKDIPYSQLLRWGVDSLYLSYKGNLRSWIETELKQLKEIAQSEDPLEVAKAQYQAGGELFIVKDKGAALFPYILDNSTLRIQVSKSGSKSLPMAYVKVASGLLAAMDIVNAQSLVSKVVSDLGKPADVPRVSRIDMFVDFVSGFDMEGWIREAWVTHASNISSYAVGGRFSGWSIGMGGSIGARLYDKTLELDKSRKFYLFDLWQKAGWDGVTPVWRLEIQFKREVLNQLGVADFFSVAANLNGLWGYALTDWLKLTLPSPSDQKRSRWPIHPLWAALSSIDWETSGGPLLREYPKDSAPSFEWLYGSLFRAVISFMAKTGCDDIEVALSELGAASLKNNEKLSSILGVSFSTFVREKVEIKRREYCTAFNGKFEAKPMPQDEIDRRASLYRKLSDGGVTPDEES